MNLERAVQLAYDLRPSASDRSIRAALPRIRELEGIEARHWKPRISRLREKAELTASGGQFYQDTRPPWMIANQASVALATTNKLVYPPVTWSSMAPTDFWQGKRIFLRLVATVTLGATGGAVTVSFNYINGTPADAGGTALATSASLAVGTGAGANMFRAEFGARVRDVGTTTSTGSLIGWGVMESAIFTSTADKLMPAAGPAAVSTLNLQVAGAFHVQMLQAATANASIVVNDLELVHEN